MGQGECCPIVVSFQTVREDHQSLSITRPYIRRVRIQVLISSSSIYISTPIPRCPLCGDPIRPARSTRPLPQLPTQSTAAPRPLLVRQQAVRGQLPYRCPDLAVRVGPSCRWRISVCDRMPYGKASKRRRLPRSRLKRLGRG